MSLASWHFPSHSRALHFLKFTLSAAMCSLKITNYGMREILYMTAQRITFYQRRLETASLGTITFLDTHVFINNPY